MLLGQLEPLWAIELDKFVLPDDNEWLDEFVAHCSRLSLTHTEALGWGNGYTSSGTFRNPMDLEMGNAPQEDRDTPRLYLMRRPAWPTARLYVLGFTEVGPVGAGFWPEVVQAALEAVGTSDRAIDWHAVLGPALNASMGYKRIFLAEAGTIGPVRMEGYDSGYAEWDNPSRGWLGAGGGIFEWWPILATGTAHAYNWEVAQRASVTDSLHRVCALLTLAWGSRLTVRGHSSRGGAIDVPEGPAGQVYEGARELRVDVALPTWGDEAWRRLDEDDRLSDALAMYYEGCELEAQHPSFALAAFISTVEWLKQLDKGAPRCPDCRQVMGSTQRYKDAVAEVLGPERAKLAADAYTPRSHTVHRARLHGDEKRVGHFIVGSTFEDSEKDFRWVTLRYPKEAAQKWLLRSFGAE